MGPQCADAHDGQKRVSLHNRPDIRLHPISINATIVYCPADIREESIYVVRRLPFARGPSFQLAQNRSST
jgi:hypothetical protein